MVFSAFKLAFSSRLSVSKVQYVGVDSTDKKRFAYLTHYSRLGLIFCHMFAKPKNDDVVGVLRGLVEAKQREMAELSGADDRAAEAEGAEKTTGGTVGIFEVLLMGSVPLRQFRLRRSSAPDAKAANYRKYQVCHAVSIRFVAGQLTRARAPDCRQVGTSRTWGGKQVWRWRSG